MKICDGDACTGCSACAAVCAKKAIAMEANESGFLFPRIDMSKCVNCHMCESVCPQNKNVSGVEGQVYAALARNDSLRERSSSGGVFYLLAEWILRNHGVVYGAAYDREMTLRHTAVFTEEELTRLQGSKYVQSEVGETYLEARSMLEGGRWVLYSGTPCQIAGLRAFLKKEYDRLLTVDILCHGVPAPGVFHLYVDSLQQKYGKRIANIQFRSKHLGWKNYCTQVVFRDGSKQIELKDTYVYGFLKDLYLRKSCYQCQYATSERVGDITLGDFWGYQETAPEHIEDDNRGISLMMVNSKNGEIALRKIKRKLAMAPRTITEAETGNPVLRRSSTEHKQSLEFWKDYASGVKWDDLCRKYFAEVKEKKDILSKEDREYFSISYNRRHIRHLIHCWKVEFVSRMRGSV